MSPRNSYRNSRRESSVGTSQPDFLTRDKSLLEPITERGMDSLWWTLGSANLLEANQLQSVIEAAYSLIKIGQVKSAEYLLKPFTSELAEVRPTVGK